MSKPLGSEMLDRIWSFHENTALSDLSAAQQSDYTKYVDAIDELTYYSEPPQEVLRRFYAAVASYYEKWIARWHV
jgi:hypothetical protein